MLLGLFLANGRIRGAECARIKLLGLPNEVLNQVSLVLGEQQQLGLLNNIDKFGYKLSPLG